MGSLMKSSVEPLEGNKVKLYVEVDEAEFDRDIDQAFKAIAREVKLPGFRVRQKRALLRALEVYGTTNRGFGDAMILATMEQRGSQQLYSYDRGFDRLSGITRVES